MPDAQIASPDPSEEVQGLGSIPADWPELPNNSSLQSELGWVQAERLRVVSESGGRTTVRLERGFHPSSFNGCALMVGD